MPALTWAAITATPPSRGGSWRTRGSSVRSESGACLVVACQSGVGSPHVTLDPFGCVAVSCLFPGLSILVHVLGYEISIDRLDGYPY